MTDALTVDPPGCGCTDCITGRSIPLERLSVDELKGWIHGKHHDRTNDGTHKRVKCAIHDAKRDAVNGVLSRIIAGDLR